MRFQFLFLALLSINVINAQNIIDEVSFSYGDITHLEVEGSFAKVEIKGVAGDELTFDGKLTGRDRVDNVKIKYEKSGSKLHVWIDRPSRMNNWSNNLNGQLTFTVPKSILLYIDNSSGAIHVDNINAKTCRLESSSGAIYANQITAETYLESSSGRINAEGINGNIEGKSSSGRQIISNVKGNIQTVSSSGRIVLANVEGRLDLRNTSGGITGEEIYITGNSKFRSTSGSIKMELTKDIESYTYECKASSGSIYIGDKKVGKDAYYKYGNILIEGQTSSGSQKYWSK